MAVVVAVTVMRVLLFVFHGCMLRGLGLGFTNPVRTGGMWDVCLGCGGVMSVCFVCLDSLCRWQVQVSLYCARRIPAYIRCTQSSNLLLISAF